MRRMQFGLQNSRKPAGLVIQHCPFPQQSSRILKAQGRSSSTGPPPGRVLFIGGIPWDIDAGVVGDLLQEPCSAATHIQVVGHDDSERKRYPAGAKHQGFALAAFRSAEAMQAAATALTQADRVSGWPLKVGPAEKVPSEWPLWYTANEAEIAQLEKQRAAAQRRRQHLRRRRHSQKHEHLDLVSAVLGALAAPSGAAVWQQYTPLALLGGGALLGGLMEAAGWPLRAGAPPAALQEQLTRQEGSPLPSGLAEDPDPRHVEQQLLLDWQHIPQACDPAFGGQLAAADVVLAGNGPVGMRALRKRIQVETFALLLLQLLHLRQAPATAAHGCSQPDQPALRMVDFGSGSGNLLLPLAYLFPSCRFTAVDFKPAAVQLVQKRAAAAGLHNVAVVAGTIEGFSEPFDVGLALHACGAATDWAMEQCWERGAAFVVSPCCIGKVQKALAGPAAAGEGSRLGPIVLPQAAKERLQAGRAGYGRPGEEEQHQGRQLSHPRSKWMRECLASLVAAGLGDGSYGAAQGSSGGSMAAVTQQQIGGQVEAMEAPGSSAGSRQHHQQQQQQAMLSSRSTSTAAAASASDPAAPEGGGGGSRARVSGNNSAGALATAPREQAAEGGALQQSLQLQELYGRLAKAADFSHHEQHGYYELAVLAKASLELDRSRAMAERGYHTWLVKLLQPELTAKSDVIVGVPEPWVCSTRRLGSGMLRV